MPTTRFTPDIYSGLDTGPHPNTGTPLLVKTFTFDPTQASGTATGEYLPENAIVFDIWSDGAATGPGGCNVNIGIDGDADGLIRDFQVDDPSITASVYAPDPSYYPYINFPFSTTLSSYEILAGKGSTPPTGGTLRIYILYFLYNPDDYDFAI